MERARQRSGSPRPRAPHPAAVSQASRTIAVDEGGRAGAGRCLAGRGGPAPPADVEEPRRVSETSLRSVSPAAYPPAGLPEVIAAPVDADPIEVGVCIVGAGPAGLACAIRLGQLLAGDPASAERLGEVPVVVVEKGKQ